MRASSILPYLAGGITTLSGASAQDASWSTIPDIEIYGQHFFYTNNGSQFYMKGVAYQQGYQPTGTKKRDDDGVRYTDPLANADTCARDIPYMKQIFTNVIRVYAIDPTADHDDCMEQLASNGIYVVADLSEPGTSIDSNDPAWDAPLFQRYAAVVDAMSKYKNVIGFFAGNEVVSAANQTAAAAFVKAAVRDTKGYIRSQDYRQTLGVGYATADVPTRDHLAAYFACEPTDEGNATSIDFWGYNVYSWCGESTYEESKYGERVEFFRDYPVPVFFAEYGCIEGIDGGPTHRPFTEVGALYGNMTEVFSGGIVYEYFMEANEYGLVSIDGSSVSPYPDFTSLMSQLRTVSPTITQSSEYTPSNTAPACPTVDSSWAAEATPLPPAVNPQLCECEMAVLECTVATDDAERYASAFDFICGEGDYCAGIEHNATTGSYGAISGCSPEQQLAFVANQYYLANDRHSDACDFSGVASTQAASTPNGCASLLDAAGTGGTGSVPSPTGQQGTAASSSSEGAAPSSLNAPAFFNYGKLLFIAYVALAVVSVRKLQGSEQRWPRRDGRRKVAKRRAGRAVPENVNDADHAGVRDVPDGVVEDAPEEMAAEDGPGGAVENAPIPMVEDTLDGAPAADGVSEDAVESASEKREKGTVAPRDRQPSDEESHPAVEPKTKTAVANASDTIPVPTTPLSNVGIPVDTWRRLEEVSRKAIPRFLFRCFQEGSGGRIGLNAKDGITPLGFLGKKPTNVYDIENPRNTVNGHLPGWTTIKTEFSSWSADFTFTSGMIRALETNAFIAILDTTLLAPHVKVYYTPELHAASISEAAAYYYEYLVYGPIGGPAYHCVELVDMPKQNFDVICGLFSPKSAATSKITEEHVVAARNTATFFRRPEDGRPDIVIVMTAAFLVLHDGWGESEVLSDSAWGLVQTHLDEEFKAVRLPACSLDAVGLANPNTHATKLPNLRRTINLLMTIEARLKALRRAQMQPLEARPCKARTGDSSEVPGNEKDSIVEDRN
ncbi:hypothetical protein DL769_004394 [Monosporascus sp. CRB-8-3]|nr:hypothetical protein DL769_004394 [Monosporascus sp. CRB-8-3]